LWLVEMIVIVPGAPGAPHLGHHDPVGVFGHVEHLVGVMPHRAVLLLALFP
jgi:hypothetical protein